MYPAPEKKKMSSHDFEIRQVIQAVPGIVCTTEVLIEVVAALSALLDENKETRG